MESCKTHIKEAKNLEHVTLTNNLVLKYKMN
jgi:hypothetical protein